MFSFLWDYSLKPEGEARRSHIIDLKRQGYLCFAAYGYGKLLIFGICRLCSIEFFCVALLTHVCLTKAASSMLQCHPVNSQSNGKALFAHILVALSTLSNMNIIISMATAYY